MAKKNPKLTVTTSHSSKGCPIYKGTGGIQEIVVDVKEGKMFGNREVHGMLGEGERVI